MTTFDESERGYEAKFDHGQDRSVRLVARRDKLFADWAANELGLSGPDRAAFTLSVLRIPEGAGRDERLLAFMGTRFAQRPDFPLETWLGANLASCAIEAHVFLRPGGHI